MMYGIVRTLESQMKQVLSLIERFVLDLSTIDQRKDCMYVPIQGAQDILRHRKRLIDVVLLFDRIEGT